MKSVCSTLCIAATAFVLAAIAAAQPTKTPATPPTTRTPDPIAAPPPAKDRRPLDLLPKASRDAIGIDAMTDAQRKALEDLVLSLITSGSTARAAEAYMENEGFRKVTVSSPERAKLDKHDIEREWIVVDCGLKGRWAVEPPFRWTGVPGRYWAKVSAFGPTAIVDGSGTELRLTFGEVKELR